ncbi:sigma-E factor negative regulatory protein [Pusillimonas sp. DMV24BSW_D]|uniref:sigma-E factor negative regulatory protein n=1 Tax=Neopusillimonas aestuarii TaxID=2716226 RepID=UPI0014084FC4|nr:sigma-E factor negative regulatory protein [Pusillimonas sp. DMV24BSW_D]QIM49145.1 sigma-E factor negative regulatory protein [Pusillimonas sp. DMV24BSW_D]
MHTQTRSDYDPSWEESVSTWVDGEAEIRAEDLDTPYGRQLWDTYHLIGDVMRSNELALQPSDRFYARVSKAIDDEPAIVAPRFRKPSPVWRAGVSGLAVAAAVASVVWVALPYFVGGQGNDNPPVLATADESGLHDYVSAHQQFAGVNPVRQVSFQAGAGVQ